MSDGRFLVNDRFCLSFPIFSCLYIGLPYMTIFVAGRPLFHQKFFHITFFRHFVLSRISFNTTSPSIGRTDAWAAPHLKFWGSVPPVSPKSPPAFRRYTFRQSCNSACQVIVRFGRDRSCMLAFRVSIKKPFAELMKDLLQICYKQ